MSWFSAKPSQIKRAIAQLAATSRPLIVHNLAFEKGVFETLYPDLQFNWFCDTMRLAQLHDNGGDWRDQIFSDIGDLDEEESPDLGLSLEAVASRVLQRDLHHHKDERDDYLRTLGVRSRFGGHIHLLPPDILERYNTADTTITLEIYETLAPLLDGVWQKDWLFYHNRTRLMNSAYRRGIPMEIVTLEVYVYTIDADIDRIEAEFNAFHTENIKKWAEMTENTPESFNVGSNKQLKELFCDVLGMTAAHMTKKGEERVKKKEITREEALKLYPSFQSKHLGDWGESGMILIKRRKRMLVLAQALSTLEMAKQGGGRVHPEQRVAGTRTNRVSGGRDE
jgi:DNA polymerase I-like protein with 3'-5' exonuclease and polymerase domains